MPQDITGYRYATGSHSQAHAYLLPAVRAELAALPGERRIFDLGRGNGTVAAVLAGDGFLVTGVDPSSEGIAQAKTVHPELRLELGSAYDDLLNRFGTFPIVASLQVVEHVHAPRAFARTSFDLIEPGGYVVVSTPHHGYWKNLVLAVTGKLDNHFTALWDDGHIKFWSIRTLGALLTEAGFAAPRFLRVGRLPILAKSMIAIARKLRR